MVLTPSGNGLTISGSSDWQLGGNVGTTPGTQFLGTTDNQPLVLKVNNATALRIDPAANGPNMVGGLAAIRPTVITSGVRGAVVGGGGAPAGPVTGNGGGDFHAIYDSDGTIGGGFGNKVGNANANVNDAPFGTVGGGVFNGAANYASTVAGGDGNFAGGVRAAIGGGAGNQALSDNSAVAGGANNVIRANSQSATIAGGQSNLILSNSPTATIAGGLNNSVSPGDIGYVSAKGATIAGGEGNTIFGFGGFPEGPLYNEYGTIGGGYSNTVNVSYGTVPGGYLNTVLGDFGFAAGSRAVAGYGCFVWADASSASPFQSTAGNQFGIRAAGGVRLDPNTTSLFFGSGAKLWPDQGGSIELGDSLANGVTPYIDFHYGIGADQDYSVRLINDAPGFLTCSGIFRAPVVQQTSDRNAKNNFKPINAREVLEKVGALPISQWEFKQYPGTRHLGPTAQDFKAAFNLGTDDKHIATVDSEGVALAAIQGLNQKVEEKDSEIRELRTRVEKLEKLLTRELHAKGN